MRPIVLIGCTRNNSKEGWADKCTGEHAKQALARTQHTLLLTRTGKHAAPTFICKQAAAGAKTVSEHEQLLLLFFQQIKTMISFQQDLKEEGKIIIILCYTRQRGNVYGFARYVRQK